jgi:hypothetical protein
MRETEWFQFILMFYRFLREFEKHFSLKDTVREIQQTHPEMYPLPCYCLAPFLTLSLPLSLSAYELLLTIIVCLLNLRFSAQKRILTTFSLPLATPLLPLRINPRQQLPPPLLLEGPGQLQLLMKE